MSLMGLPGPRAPPVQRCPPRAVLTPVLMPSSPRSQPPPPLLRPFSSAFLSDLLSLVPWDSLLPDDREELINTNV